MDRSTHRLRAASAIVAGIVALVAVAVVALLFADTVVDGDPEPAELVVLVAPVVLAAGIVGFVVGWLVRLWLPGERRIGEIERATSALETAEVRIAELEERVAEAEARPTAPEPVPDPAPDPGTQDVPDAAAEQPAATRTVTPPPEPEPAPAPAVSMDEVPEVDLDQDAAAARVRERFGGDDGAKPDDLKMIKGIGPVLERLLNEMGVRRFEQVASFTGEDVAVVSKALDAFADRIVRDDWVGQAAELHRQTRAD